MGREQGEAGDERRLPEPENDPGALARRAPRRGVAAPHLPCIGRAWADLSGASAPARSAIVRTVAALEGVLVADFSRVLAGPLAAMTLGDLGADVIKVESPSGDKTRSWRPPADPQVRASYHHAANRNKRSVVLDLKDDGDLELADALCNRADVVIANFKPGTLERFGLDYARVAATNPGRLLRDQRLRRAGGPRPTRLRPARPGGRRPDEHHRPTGAAVEGRCRDRRRRHGALRDRRDPRRAPRTSTERPRAASDDRPLHTNLAMLANQSAGWLASGIVPEALGNTHPSIEPFTTYRARTAT